MGTYFNENSTLVRTPNEYLGSYCKFNIPSWRGKVDTVAELLHIFYVYFLLSQRDKTQFSKQVDSLLRIGSSRFLSHIEFPYDQTPDTKRQRQ